MRLCKSLRSFINTRICFSRTIIPFASRSTILLAFQFSKPLLILIREVAIASNSNRSAKPNRSSIAIFFYSKGDQNRYHIASAQESWHAFQINNTYTAFPANLRGCVLVNNISCAVQNYLRTIRESTSAYRFWKSWSTAAIPRWNRISAFPKWLNILMHAALSGEMILGNLRS